MNGLFQRIAGQQAKGDRHAGRVGEHFELAEDWSRAAEWYTRAGIQAQDTYAPEAAATYYQKVLDFFKDQKPGSEKITRKREICRRLGEVLNWQARYVEAAGAYQLLLELSEEIGDLESLSRAYYGLATSLGYQGDHRASLECALQSEKLKLELRPAEIDLNELVKNILSSMDGLLKARPTLDLNPLGAVEAETSGGEAGVGAESG